MRSATVVIVLAGLCLVGCARSTPESASLAGPTAPTAGTAVAVSTAEVPFHSDVVWEKVEGSQVDLCTPPPPPGKVYLQRNTQYGTAVTSHLGTGQFLGHTCVYGTRERGPEGWLGDVAFTAANGDVLLLTSAFQDRTGAPGKSVALEAVTFRDGGTGRFQFAKGGGTCYVNAPGRLATYEASLTYGKKE